jgi:hypothetical protein
LAINKRIAYRRRGDQALAHARQQLSAKEAKSKAFTGLRPAKPQSKAFTGLRPASHFFTAEKVTKNASRRTHVGAAPAAPIRCASGQTQAGAELARPCASNTGAYSLRLPVMLAVLYGAWSHSARASMRYMPAFPCYPTASWQRRIRAFSA